MGWLGWSESETLDADMNSILVAYEALQMKLKLCYGITSKDPDAASGSDMRQKAKEMNESRRARGKK